MSDFEFFGGSEGGESYDPAAFERFKQKMQANAQFIAALQKGEQKQKKNEDALHQLLMHFFQSHQNQGVTLLAARLLEQNIPALFVLRIIILGNEDLQKQVADLLKLGPAASEESDASVAHDAAPVLSIHGALNRQPHADSMQLVPQFKDQTIPLRIKIQLDEWSRDMLDAARTYPYRILQTTLDKEGAPKQVIIDCMANVLENFFEKNGITEPSYESAFKFCELVLHGVLGTLKRELEDQKLLKEGSDGANI